MRLPSQLKFADNKRPETLVLTQLVMYGLGGGEYRRSEMTDDRYAVLPDDRVYARTSRHLKLSFQVGVVAPPSMVRFRRHVLRNR